jgi:hypothetical protein
MFRSNDVESALREGHLQQVAGSDLRFVQPRSRLPY